MFENIAILAKILQQPKDIIPTLFNEVLVKNLEKEMYKNSTPEKNIMYIFQIAKNEQQENKPCIRTGYMSEGKFIDTYQIIFVEEFVLNELKQYPKMFIDSVVDMVAKSFNKEGTKIDNLEQLIPQLFSLMTNYLIEQGIAKNGSIKYLLRFKTADKTKGTVILETCWYDDGKIEMLDSIVPSKLYQHFENKVKSTDESPEKKK